MKYYILLFYISYKKKLYIYIYIYNPKNKFLTSPLHLKHLSVSVIITMRDVDGASKDSISKLIIA